MNTPCILCGNIRQCCSRCGFTDACCWKCSIDLRYSHHHNKVVCVRCMKKYKCDVPECSRLTVRICRDCKSAIIDSKVCEIHHPYESLCDHCITTKYTCQICKKITTTWTH